MIKYGNVLLCSGFGQTAAFHLSLSLPSSSSVFFSLAFNFFAVCCLFFANAIIFVVAVFFANLQTCEKPTLAHTIWLEWHFERRSKIRWLSNSKLKAFFLCCFDLLSIIMIVSFYRVDFLPFSLRRQRLSISISGIGQTHLMKINLQFDYLY